MKGNFSRQKDLVDKDSAYLGGTVQVLSIEFFDDKIRRADIGNGWGQQNGTRHAVESVSHGSQLAVRGSDQQLESILCLPTFQSTNGSTNRHAPLPEYLLMMSELQIQREQAWRPFRIRREENFILVARVPGLCWFGFSLSHVD